MTDISNDIDGNYLLCLKEIATRTIKYIKMSVPVID